MSRGRFMAFFDSIKASRFSTRHGPLLVGVSLPVLSPDCDSGAVRTASSQDCCLLKTYQSHTAQLVAEQ